MHLAERMAALHCAASLPCRCNPSAAAPTNASAPRAHSHRRCFAVSHTYMLRCTQTDTWQLCAGEAGGLRQCCRNSAVDTSEIDLAMASEAARPAGGAECEVRNRGGHSSPGGSNADPAAVLSGRRDVHAQGWQPAHILAAGLRTLQRIQRKRLTDRCQSRLARLAALPPPALVPLPVAAARAEQKV